jgi:carbohydrate-binding DOMON domain-containing protein
MRVIAEADDPAGDDAGDGNYTYPANAFFRTGSFDLRNFLLEEDSTRLAFTLHCSALSDPGWHPEYGFQLTYFAVVIDTDGAPGTGQTLVGRNARWRLPDSSGFERVIYVGGGLSIENGANQTLAGYVPMEGSPDPPLGDATTGTVHFTLPKSLLGNPTPRWRISVLVGAQDDHGGSGVGEFRTVNPTRSEWNGGGRIRSDAPNVYDVLLQVRPTIH